MAKKQTNLLILMGILLLVSPVMAQEIEVDPGITPDQGILWELDKIIERIQIRFTSGLEEKATLKLQIASERLAEMEAMMEQNKLQYMNRAEVERGKIINEIEEDAKGLSEEHKAFVRERLRVHVNMLNEVKETAPEQAQIRLQTAIEKSRQVLSRIGKSN